MGVYLGKKSIFLIPHGVYFIKGALKGCIYKFPKQNSNIKISILTLLIYNYKISHDAKLTSNDV